MHSKLKEYLRCDNLFYLIMIVTIIWSAVFIGQTRGANWDGILFSDMGDSFMDFFHPINHSFNWDPYIAVDRIYPALPYLLYGFLSLFIPREICELGGSAIKGSYQGMIVFIIYNVVTIFLTVILMNSFIKISPWKKYLATFLLLMSAPFLFQFQRTNIILVTFIFIMIYIKLVNSKNKIYRELSIICLVIASCIKIYPAIFGLKLLKEKRYFDVLKCILYGIVFFILPFHFMGGFSRIFVMMNNLFKGVTEGTEFGYKVNITNTMQFLNKWFGFSTHSKLYSIMALVLLIVSIFSYFLIKTEWKSMLILSVLVATIPGISFSYSIIFLAIPLLMFLNESTYKKEDYLYMLLFVFSFASFVFVNKKGITIIAGGNYHYVITTLIEGIALIAFLVILNLDGLNAARIMLKKNRSKTIGKSPKKQA